MADLIDRQAAIDALAKFVPYAICDASTESYTNGLTDAYNLICQLPPAQPEKHTKKRTETHACDCISKAKVCEILADIYPTDGEKIVAVKDIDEAYEKILQLPSAQPPAIPLQWIESHIEWLKSLDNAFATLTARQISTMVKKWKDEQDG